MTNTSMDGDVAVLPWVLVPKTTTTSDDDDADVDAATANACSSAMPPPPSQATRSSSFLEDLEEQAQTSHEQQPVPIQSSSNNKNSTPLVESGDMTTRIGSNDTMNNNNQNATSYIVGKISRLQGPFPAIVSSSAVDLDVSITDSQVTNRLSCSFATSTATTVRFATIVQSAMENYHLYDKESSKLSQIWLACDENQQISMPDALEAAVTDMMNLQSLLVAAEHKLCECEMAAVAQHDHDREVAAAQYLALRDKLDASTALVQQLQTSKLRMIANLKQKKKQLDVREAELDIATRDAKHYACQAAALRAELQSVTELRYALKSKYKSLNESVKDSRHYTQDLEKRLRRSEQARALEGELLDNFRKLAIHTG